MKLRTIVALALAGVAAARLIGMRFAEDEADNSIDETPLEDEVPMEPGADDEDIPGTSFCQAEIVEAVRDLDPVTLQGWSRVIFRCEDGVERRMCFPGGNGVHLTAGEQGILEHREGAFVSFEKPTGEIVGALYHIPAGAEEETDE